MIKVTAELFRANGVWCIRLRDVPKGVAEEFYEDALAVGNRLYIGGVGTDTSHTSQVDVRPVPAK